MPTSRPNGGYNQAFFKHIWIKARWDDELRQTVAEVEGVGLTKLYALLLANNATEEALVWRSGAFGRP